MRNSQKQPAYIDQLLNFANDLIHEDGQHTQQLQKPPQTQIQPVKLNTQLINDIDNDPDLLFKRAMLQQLQQNPNTISEAQRQKIELLRQSDRQFDDQIRQIYSSLNQQLQQSEIQNFAKEIGSEKANQYLQQQQLQNTNRPVRTPPAVLAPISSYSQKRAQILELEQTILDLESLQRKQKMELDMQENEPLPQANLLAQCQPGSVMEQQLMVNMLNQQRSQRLQHIQLQKLKIDETSLQLRQLNQQLQQLKRLLEQKEQREHIRTQQEQLKISQQQVELQRLQNQYQILQNQQQENMAAERYAERQFLKFKVEQNAVDPGVDLDYLHQKNRERQQFVQQVQRFAGNGVNAVYPSNVAGQ